MLDGKGNKSIHIANMLFKAAVMNRIRPASQIRPDAIHELNFFQCARDGSIRIPNFNGVLKSLARFRPSSLALKFAPKSEFEIEFARGKKG